MIEHVPVTELPAAWQARLAQPGASTVTVRIEQDAAQPTEAFVTDDPAFGMWRDREDTADVADCVCRLREARFRADGSRNKP